MVAAGQVQGVGEVHALGGQLQGGGDALGLLGVDMTQSEQVLEDADDLRGLEAVEGTQDPFQLQYHGQGQVTGSKRGGLLGLLSGLFGGAGTPAYAGTGQAPASGASFTLFPQTPQYHRPAPAVEVDPTTPADELPDPSGGDADGVEPQAKAITIIVRPGPGTTVQEVAQFLQDRVLDD